MPRTLADLTDEERKALLNAHWEEMLNNEIASPTGTNTPIASPLGKTARIPSDLAGHLKPGGKGLAHAWSVNGICDDPVGGLKDKVSLPAKLKKTGGGR